LSAGADPGFQVRGVHLKKMCRAEGGVVPDAPLDLPLVCLMSVYVCMYMYCYTQKGFLYAINKDKDIFHGDLVSIKCY
jgi:hypothetical protein